MTDELHHSSQQEQDCQASHQHILTGELKGIEAPLEHKHPVQESEHTSMTHSLTLPHLTNMSKTQLKNEC